MRRRTRLNELRRVRDAAVLCRQTMEPFLGSKLFSRSVLTANERTLVKFILEEATTLVASVDRSIMKMEAKS